MTVEIFDCAQNTPEWHALRVGIPTASNFASILAKGEGKMRKSYLYKLAGEIFTGEPADSFTSVHMERGHEWEDEARNLYAMLHNQDPVQVGFVRNGRVGCSPDSLIGDKGGLEIKTRLPHLQIDALLAGKLPSEHKAQVQGSIWIAEREWWDFAAYSRRLPLFVVRVERDEAYIKAMKAEIDLFLEDLDDLVRKIKDMGAQTYAEAMAVPEMVMEI